MQYCIGNHRNLQAPSVASFIILVNGNCPTFQVAILTESRRKMKTNKWLSEGIPDTIMAVRIFLKNIKRFNKRFSPVFLLPVAAIILLVIYAKYQNNSGQFLASVKQTVPTPTVAPSPTTMPIFQQVTRVIIKPTSIPTSFPTNTPIPTLNPCRLGSPTPVTADPSVRLGSISPTSGKVGDTIIISGSGFGKSSFYYPDPTKFLGGVSFYGMPCGYNSGGASPAETGAGWWSDDTIKVRVPGVSPGIFQIEVISSDGKRSARISFQVLQ